MSKVWFVTGSSRGLGRSFVEAALSHGDQVVATARDTGRLDDLVAAYGDAVLPLELDVSSKAAVFDTMKRAVDHFGRLDVIVNNAGYGLSGAVEELTEQDLRDQVAGFGIKVTVVEPGTYATGGAAGAAHAEGDPRYDGLRERFAEYAKTPDFADPAAAGAALLKLADADNPPLRVFFGTQGFPIVQQVYTDRLKTWSDWQPLATAAHR
jgi:NAD(P)-dependent dehydrogenase (short-subunit alcohol dehydrogenase family)